MKRTEIIENVEYEIARADRILEICGRYKLEENVELNRGRKEALEWVLEMLKEDEDSE